MTSVHHVNFSKNNLTKNHNKINHISPYVHMDPKNMSWHKSYVCTIKNVIYQATAVKNVLCRDFLYHFYNLVTATIQFRTQVRKLH